MNTIDIGRGSIASRRRQTPFRFGNIVVSVGAVVVAVLCTGRGAPQTLQTGGLNAGRAYGYLLKVCRLGPRVSGSEGMAAEQKLISAHFVKLGASVRFQSFDIRHPTTARAVRMNNIIVSWNPRAKQRILIGCHYDTRPFPDRDRSNPRGRFLGANDGASGVALLMEMGHVMKRLKIAYGVDFVFFDGEELVYGNVGKYFHGSEYFARNYRAHPPGHRYVYGVLVDMVADKDLNLPMEKNSLKYAPRLTRSIWATARRLKVKEFSASVKHELLDDHLPLNRIAKIPTCDIIDFDYPYWHTTEDTPRKCSGKSLVTVGRVLTAWLEELPPIPPDKSP